MPDRRPLNGVDRPLILVFHLPDPMRCIHHHELYQGPDEDNLVAMMEGLPEDKIKCSVLSPEALADYRRKHMMASSVEVDG